MIAVVLIAGTALTGTASLAQGTERGEQETEGELVLVDESDVDEVDREGRVIHDYGESILMEVEKENQMELEKEFDVTSLDYRTNLRVRGHEFDIQEGFPDFSRELEIDPDTLNSEDLQDQLTMSEDDPDSETLTRETYIVQMIGPRAPEWRMELEEMEVDILGSIHPYGYEVRMSPDRAERVRDLDYVESLELFQPGFKIAPELTMDLEDVEKIAGENEERQLSGLEDSVETVDSPSDGLPETSGTIAEGEDSIETEGDIQGKIEEAQPNYPDELVVEILVLEGLHGETQQEIESNVEEIQDIADIPEGNRVRAVIEDEVDLINLAQISDVYHITPNLEPQLHEMSSQVVAGGSWHYAPQWEWEDPDPPDREPETPVDPYRHDDPEWAPAGPLTAQEGYTGEDRIISVADTGIGDGTHGDAGHDDFTGRIVSGYDWESESTEEGEFWDADGHGTGVAGMAASDSYHGTGYDIGHEELEWTGLADEDYWSEDYYASMGVAPEADIHTSRIAGDDGGLIIPDDLHEVPEQAIQQEPELFGQTHSWGTMGAYGGYVEQTSQIDAAVRDANRDTEEEEPLYITFSAGNDGARGEGTVGEPGGTAKNVVSVGGTMNYEPSDEFMDPNPSPDMWDVGSWGWTDDNRIKPDVAGPASNVLTTMWYDDPDTDPNYVGYAGTSFSSPTAQGAGATIADWYEEHPLVEGSPSPAMTRALLTNTATQTYEDLDGDGTIDYRPNKQMGWGRMDLTPLVDHDLPEGGPFMMYDGVSCMTEEMEETYLTTGDEEDYTVAPMDEDEPLKMTLAWDDKEAQAGADPTLQNDLRLEVESPEGEIYRGNAFAEDEGAESTSGFSYSDTEVMSDFDMTGDGYDDVNNLLSVYVEDPEPGAYEVRVKGHDIPEYANPNIDEPNQDFALAVQNSFVTEDGMFSMDRGRYAKEDTVDFSVIDEDMTDQDTVDIEVRSFDEEGYTIDELLNFTLRGEQTGIVTGELDIGPDYEHDYDGLYVEHGGEIEATYYDESMEEDKYAFADIDGVPPEPASYVEVDWYDELVDTADNLITWNLSEDDGGEYFEGYRIYRAEAEDGDEPDEDDWEYLDTVATGEDEYLDEDAGEYDYTRYWYEVAAVDDVGNEEKTGYPDIEPATVRVDMPEGSETWTAGEEETIEWYAATGGFDSELTLDYSTDAGESWESIMVEEDVDQGEGSYDWTVDEDIEGTNHESMIRAAIEDDEYPTTSGLLSGLDQREDNTQSERPVAVIDDWLGFGDDWVDILEDELADEFEVEHIHSDDALEDIVDYESYFVHSLDSDNEDEWFEETDGIGTVYTANIHDVETLSQRSDVIDDPDSVTLNINLAHWTIDDMHPILEDVAEVGDRIPMHTSDWEDGASFTDTAADVFAEADDGDNAFGVCDDRQDVLTTAIGFDSVLPGTETDYARQIAANSVEYVAEDIEHEPPSQVCEIEYLTARETIKLEWERPDERFSDRDITHYNVYRNDELIAEPEDEMYIDTDVDNWEYYEYNVSAVNPEGEGDRSPSVTVQPTPPFDTSDEFVLTEYETPEFYSIDSPQDGDTYYMNTTEKIEWEIEEGDGELTSLELGYSFDGGETWYFYDEIEDPDEEGEYDDWELPNYITDEALISFDVEDEYELYADELSGEFEIIAAEPPENLEVDHVSLEEEKLFYDDLSDGESEEGYETGEDPEGVNEWEVRDHGASVGDYSWDFGDVGYEEVDDAGLSWFRTPEIDILDNSTWSELSFEHWRDFDWRYDGGNMRISTDYGDTWDLIEPEEGYPDTISDEFDNPLAGEEGWTKAESWEEVTFDLDDYIGETVQFEWRAGVDSWDPEGSQGWRIDDIEVRADPLYEGEQRHGDNRLTWDASPDDGAGEDTVFEYNIYRSDTEEAENEDELEEHIASVEADGSDEYHYFDRGAGTEDGKTWYYHVRAGTEDNRSTVYDPEDNNDNPNNGLMDSGTEDEDVGYAFDIEPGDDSLWFPLDDPSNLNYIAPNEADDFVAGATWYDDTWYGASFDGEFWTICEETGDMEHIGSTPAEFNGLAFDDATDTMYASCGDALWEVDPETGDAEEIGDHEIGFTMITIASDGQGNLYGTTVDFDVDADLYEIDPDTGEAESIGDTDLPLVFAQDMAYDKDEDVLYHAAYFEAEDSGLYELCTDTGEPTHIGDFPADEEIAGFAIPTLPVEDVQAESWSVTEQEPLAPYPPADEEPEEDSAISPQQHEATELSFEAGHGCMETEMDVSFYDGETEEEIGTDTVYANERASIEWDELSQGEYSWYVEIDDGDYLLTEEFTFEVDNYDPEVDIFQPEDGDIYGDSDVTVAWDGYDEWSGIDYYEVRLRDHIEWTEVPGEYDGVELEDVPDDDHIVDVRATDSAGNQAEDTVEFTVNTAAPSVEIVRPQHHDAFVEDEVKVEWNGYDEHIDIDYYEVRVEDESWTNVGLSEDSIVDGLEEGENLIQVRGTDVAGNQYVDAVEVFYGTAPPDVNTTSPEEGAVFDDGEVTVEWEAEGNISDVTKTEIKLNDYGWIDYETEEAGIVYDEGEKIWEESHDGTAHSVYESDGVVYSGLGDDTVIAYDAEDQEVIWQHEHHDGRVRTVVEEDGVVYSASADDTVVAADATDGSFIWQHEEHDDDARGLDVLDGIVYSGSTDYTVIAYDSDTEEKLWRHEHHDDSIWTVTEYEGVVYSGANDDTVVAVDAENGDLIWQHEEHDATVRGLDVQDEIVYSGSLDDTVIAYDSEEERKLWQHEHHDSTVNSVYESDGLVFSGSMDDTVIAYDSEEERKLWQHQYHDGTVNSVYESDGVVYSGSFDLDHTVVAAGSGVEPRITLYEFSHNFTDLPDGEHTVYVRATDEAGNRHTEMVNFTIDTPEATLDIIEPEDGIENLTYEEEFTIEGQTDVDASVYIDGEEVVVDDDGYFEYTMMLDEGINVFDVKAEHPDGDVAETEVNALYLPQIPEMLDDIDDLEDEIDDNRDAIDDLEDVTDQLEIDISDLEDELHAEVNRLEDALDDNVTALEDAIEENRTDLIDIIDDNVTYLEGELEDVEDDIDDLWTEIDDINTTIGEMKDDISENRDDIDELFNVTDELGIDISDLEDELHAEVDTLEDALDDNVTALEDAIEENRTDFIDIIDDNITDIEDELDEIHDEIDLIYSEIDMIYDQMDMIEDQIDDLDDDIDDLQVQIDDLEDDLDDAVDDLEDQIDALENDLDDAVDDLEDQIDALENDLDDAVDDLESQIDGLEDELDDAVDDLESQIDALENDLDDAVDDLEDQIDALEDAIDDLEDYVDSEISDRLEDYLTETEIENLLTDYITGDELDDLLADYLTYSEIELLVQDMLEEDGYVTHDELTNEIDDYLTEEEIRDLELEYITSSELEAALEDKLTEPEIEVLVDDKLEEEGLVTHDGLTNELEDYLTEEEIRDLELEYITSGELEAALEDKLTEAEIDGLMSELEEDQDDDISMARNLGIVGMILAILALVITGFAVVMKKKGGESQEKHDSQNTPTLSKKSE